MQTCTSPDSNGLFEASSSVSPGPDDGIPSFPLVSPTEPLKYHSVLPNYAFRLQEPVSGQLRMNDLPRPLFHSFNHGTTTSEGAFNLRSAPQLLPAINMPFPFAPKTGPGAQNMPDPRNKHVASKERLEAQQEHLRDARDDLIGSRFSLNTQRREFRELQEKADMQASMAFDLVTRHLNSLGIALPVNIEDAISKAAALRESQVERGVDLEEAEEKYNLEEWRYTEKETKFIEDLPGNLPTSHVPQLPMPLLETRNVDSASLTKFSFGPSEFNVNPLPPVNPGQGLFPSLENHPWEMKEPSLKDFNPKPKPNFQERPEFRPRSLTPLLPHVMSPQALELIHAPPRPHSETGLSQLQVDWSMTRKRINAWLFDILAQSRLQQGLLKDLTPREELSDDAWWKLVKLHWSSSSPDTAQFHTGDTTVSGTTRSQPVSNVTTTRLFESFEAVNPEASPSFAASSFPEDRIPGDLKSPAFPAVIKSRDLIGFPAKHVTFPTKSSSAGSRSTSPTNSTPSVSTIPTEMVRSLSYMHDSLMAETCVASAQSEDVSTIYSVNDLKDHRSDSGDQGLSTQAENARGGLEDSSLNNGSDTTAKNESPPALDDAEQVHSLDGPAPRFSLTCTRPYSPESERDHTNTRSHDRSQLHASTSDNSRMKPPSPPQTRSCSPREQRQLPGQSGPNSRTNP